MLEHYIRPYYQKIFVDPVAQRCSPYVRANVITLLSCVVGIVILPALSFQKVFLAFFLLVVSGYLDTLDGSVARFRGEISKLGAALDILSDRIVEAAIVIGFFMMSPKTRGLLTLCMMASILICVTSFLLVGIFTRRYSHKGFYYSPGLMERTEAFIFFVLMMGLPSWFPLLAIIFSILLVLTAAIRMTQFALTELSYY